MQCVLYLYGNKKWERAYAPENSMIIDYGSVAYFIPIIITAAAAFGLFFAFRRRTERTKKLVIFILMAVNILQHLLKQFVWPHYWGREYPELMNGAYNMCATLILIGPFVLISKSGAFKQFLCYVGTAAGLLTMFVPYWYIGKTMWQWDVLRYYFCHGLLTVTSVLPAMWGIYKFNWRDFYKFPFIFFALLILIAFNQLVFYALGIIGEGQNFFAVLYVNNPCWMMHPNDNFSFLIPVIDFFTPDIFFADEAAGRPYTPILWYAIPMFLLFCVLGILLGALLDNARFVADVKAFAHSVRSLFARRGYKKERYKKKSFDYKREKR